jgi:hypothetical protein
MAKFWQIPAYPKDKRQKYVGEAWSQSQEIKSIASTMW